MVASAVVLVVAAVPCCPWAPKVEEREIAAWSWRLEERILAVETAAVVAVETAVEEVAETAGSGAGRREPD